MTKQKPNVRVDSKTQPFEFLKRLGLRTDCSKQDVVIAYRSRARLAHPDHGGSSEEFQQLRQDYEHALAYVDRRRASPVRSMPTSTNGKPRLLHPRTWDVSYAIVRLLARIAICSGAVAAFGYFRPSTFTALPAALFLITLIPLSVLGLPRLSRLKSTIAYFTIIYGTLLTYLIIREQWASIFTMTTTSTSSLSSTDWIVFYSPLFLFLLLLFGGIGWLVSLTNKT